MRTAKPHDCSTATLHNFALRAPFSSSSDFFSFFHFFLDKGNYLWFYVFSNSAGAKESFEDDGQNQ
jgi:hypothetical protein